ncbi:MAG: hypothetical protein B6D73_10755 [gamma proteobacterium symbiont of Stewartia floridana]|nr:MAG: hypothetical protein B6D73_10755 [gamma proteobacterium symbiont of Stewartia floridana]
MRKQIIFPGSHGQPCVVEYEIKHELIKRVNHVVVMIYELYERNPGGSSAGFRDICEYLVNRILKEELVGVSLEFIHFRYIWQGVDGQRSSIIELTIADEPRMKKDFDYAASSDSIVGSIKTWLAVNLGGKVLQDQPECSRCSATAGIGYVKVIRDPLTEADDRGEIHA